VHGQLNLESRSVAPYLCYRVPRKGVVAKHAVQRERSRHAIAGKPQAVGFDGSRRTATYVSAMRSCCRTARPNGLSAATTGFGK